MIWTIILRFAIQDISVEGELKSLGTLIYFLQTSVEYRHRSQENIKAKLQFWSEQSVTIWCSISVSTSVMSPFFLRNICQGGPPPVVSEKDCPLQECECTKLPCQVGFWPVRYFSLSLKCCYCSCYIIQAVQSYLAVSIKYSSVSLFSFHFGTQDNSLWLKKNHNNIEPVHCISAADRIMAVLSSSWG